MERIYEIADLLGDQLDVICDALDTKLLTRSNAAMKMIEVMEEAIEKLEDVIDEEDVAAANAENQVLEELKYEPVGDDE